MNCTDFKEQVSAFALGALESHEHDACERHLADRAVHDGCWEALHQARTATTVLALAEAPVAPAPQTWDAISARISGVTPIGQPRRSSATFVPWLVAAAAVLIAVWFARDRDRMADERSAAHKEVGTLTSRVDTEAQLRVRCTTELESLKSDLAPRREALSLLQVPGTRVIALAPTGKDVTSSANVVWHSASARAFVLGTGLRAPTGKDYELWIIRGGKPIPAGVLRADESGALVATIDPALLRGTAPEAIAISLEVAGGTQVPTAVMNAGKI